MKRIFVTGSTDGLGLAAARTLMAEGHEVVLDPSRAYSESKLYLTALAFAIARRWPDVLSNAVDPGWVPTKMGGPGATDNLTQGYLTQTWLAVDNEPVARVSGGYLHHRARQQPAEEALDPAFQDRVMAKLAEMTDIRLA